MYNIEAWNMSPRIQRPLGRFDGAGVWSLRVGAEVRSGGVGAVGVPSMRLSMLYCQRVSGFPYSQRRSASPSIAPVAVRTSEKSEKFGCVS